MSNDRPKLTLARWAALDQAASDLPWHAILVGPEVGSTPQSWEVWEDTLTVAETRRGAGTDEQREAKAKFIAASRTAPTRLLAALRALAAKCDEAAAEEVGAVYKGPYEWFAEQLRHLIEQTDLAAPEQA